MSLETHLAACKADTVVHTERGEIERKSDGMRLRYELGRTRRWNIGLRKHVNELNGSVVLYYPNGTYDTFWDGFDGVRCAVAAYGGRIVGDVT